MPPAAPPLPVHERDRARPPSTCRRAPTASSARTTGRRCREALVALAARAGQALHVPDDVAGHCCATPWNSKGYADGARAHGPSDRRGAGALVRRRAPAGRHGRELLHARAARASGRRCRDDLRARYEAVHRARQPRLRRAGPAAAARRSSGRCDSVAVHAVCSVHHLGTVVGARAARRRGRRAGGEPGVGRLLRLRRRPRLAAPRAARGGAAARGRRARRASRTTRTSRATARARSG